MLSFGEHVERLRSFNGDLAVLMFHGTTNKLPGFLHLHIRHIIVNAITKTSHREFFPERNAG